MEEGKRVVYTNPMPNDKALASQDDALRHYKASLTSLEEDRSRQERDTQKRMHMLEQKLAMAKQDKARLEFDLKEYKKHLNDADRSNPMVQELTVSVQAHKDQIEALQREKTELQQRVEEIKREAVQRVRVLEAELAMVKEEKGRVEGAYADVDEKARVRRGFCISTPVHVSPCVSLIPFYTIHTLHAALPQATIGELTAKMEHYKQAVASLDAEKDALLQRVQDETRSMTRRIDDLEYELEGMKRDRVELIEHVREARDYARHMEHVIERAEHDHKAQVRGLYAWMMHALRKMPYLQPTAVPLYLSLFSTLTPPP